MEDTSVGKNTPVKVHTATKRRVHNKTPVKPRVVHHHKTKRVTKKEKDKAKRKMKIYLVVGAGALLIVAVFIPAISHKVEYLLAALYYGHHVIGLVRE